MLGSSESAGKLQGSTVVTWKFLGGCLEVAGRLLEVCLEAVWRLMEISEVD